MQKTHLIAAATFAALATLSACNSEPEVVTINKYDPQAEALRNAAPIEPPPMIQESRAYRCRDNSLIFVDFYTNNTASVRTQRGQPPVAMLTTEGGTPPYKAEGYSISGNGEQVSYTAPGKGTQSCRT